MRSPPKRSSSWPMNSTDKKEITEEDAPNTATDAIANTNRRNFFRLCSLISEELKYLNQDPDVLKKYGEAVLRKLTEAQAELTKLRELIRAMPETTPDDDPYFKTLRDELHKLKKRVTKLKAKFPSKVKIHLLESDATKTSDELKKDSLILTLLTEQKLNLPTFYGDSVFEKSEIFGNFYSLYKDLGDDFKKKLCLLCFSVFPKEAKIRRRVMIYWWMAEGFIDNKSDGTSFLETFSKMGFLLPISSKPRSHVHSYKLHPMARIVLIYLAKRARLFEFNEKDGSPSENYSSSLQALLVGQGLPEARNLDRLHMVFNLNESTLEFSPEWFPRMQNINILLLGRWQSDESHHIEVDNPELLENFKHLQFLKFLSLQGVSQVTELPDSIRQLVNLRILDLRACHNLEVIPAGIGYLRSLTHLDMSDCYLINHMPKEISNLKNLKVLMGFAVGDPTNCTLGDLGRLEKLEKLGIYMSGDDIGTEEFKPLQGFKSLKTLSISWGATRKDRLADPGDNTKVKLLNKADHKAPEKKTEAPEKKRKEASEKKKMGKSVGFKDVLDEPATSAEQDIPPASKDGAGKATGAAGEIIPKRVEDAADISPGREDEADKSIETNIPQINNAVDKSIGTIGEASPRIIKEAAEKPTPATEQEKNQVNNDQATPKTVEHATEISTATIEESSSKVKDSADADKLNSETSRQASPKSIKDETYNSIGTTEQTSNQEMKTAAEESTEATEEASIQKTNEQAGHRTLEDVIQKSTATIEQSSTTKDKTEGDGTVKPIEQEKPQVLKDSADAEKLNPGQEVNSGNVPQNINRKKDQENEKIEDEKIKQKTTLPAPTGSSKEENKVDSSKVVNTIKTNSEIEEQGEGEISKVVDDNSGKSEDSEKKTGRENEGDGEDNIAKAPKDKNLETKQGNESPVMRTTSKPPPKGSGLTRTGTMLGTIGNMFHSEGQGPPIRSNDLTLPKTLEKLQLVCYPEIKGPKWLKPENLPSLKKLYIVGGKLRDLGKIYDWNDGNPSFTKNTWKVHTLRLKYLNHMEMRWQELRHLFPELVTLETVSCPKLTLFPCDGYGMWIDKTKVVT